MYGYIYKTTNQVNNLIYIGQHKAEKFMGKRYLGSGKELKAAIEEFGRTNFICELLDTALNMTELNEKETFWISKLNSTDPNIGYNRNTGGHITNKKDHLLILGTEYIQVAKQDVDRYIKLGWTEIFQSIQYQQEYDEQLAVKPIELTLTEKAKKKQREHNHYLANKEKYIERAKNWRNKNTDKYKQWLEDNKDRLKTKNRDQYNNDLEIRAKRLEASRKYREAHKEEILEKQRKRRQQEKKQSK